MVVTSKGIPPKMPLQDSGLGSHLGIKGVLVGNQNVLETKGSTAQHMRAG